MDCPHQGSAMKQVLLRTSICRGRDKLRVHMPTLNTGSRSASAPGEYNNLDLHRWRHPAAVASTRRVPTGQSRRLRAGERLRAPSFAGLGRAAKKTMPHHVPSPPLSQQPLPGPSGPGKKYAIRCFPEAMDIRVSPRLDPTATWTAHTALRPRRGSAVHGGQRRTCIHPFPINVSSTCPLVPGRVLNARSCTRVTRDPHRSCAVASQTRPNGNCRSSPGATSGHIPSPVLQSNPSAVESSQWTKNSAALEVWSFLPITRTPALSIDV